MTRKRRLSTCRPRAIPVIVYTTRMHGNHLEPEMPLGKFPSKADKCSFALAITLVISLRKLSVSFFVPAPETTHNVLAGPLQLFKKDAALGGQTVSLARHTDDADICARWRCQTGGPKSTRHNE